ncbi:unnamed protein product [Gordionus sp. m RMFG-2023]
MAIPIKDKTAKSVVKALYIIVNTHQYALVGVCGTYNSCIHSSTGFSLYELMYGQKPRRPLTLQNKIEEIFALPEVMAKITIDECLKEEFVNMAHLKKITKLAIQNIDIAQLKQKKQHEKRTNGLKSFAIGQKVLAWTIKGLIGKGGKC